MAIRKSSISGVPFGNTANRPSNPTVGQTYYNGELGYQEIYTNTGWSSATSAGGADFTINVGSSGYTKTDLGKNFGAGSYICTSSLSDSTLDIYFLDESGNVSGYVNAATATATISASSSFRYVVLYGFTSNDTLTFQYKTVASPTTNSTTDFAIGPRIISISTSSLKNINDTTTITGQNFATDVQVTFTGAGYSSTAAKNIVRSSSTSLIVTRPDNFPPSSSPFTITVTNPGKPSPTSSNVHILSNSVTAGSAPSWSTSASLPTFTRNVAYSTTIVATDEAGSSITYTGISGSLPTGLSLNSSTGVISGTPTSSLTTTYTVRATDSGGNYVDRAFTITNVGPTWSTPSGQLALATVGSSYSATITATDDSGNAPTLSVVSGSLPSGLSLNSSTGVISGTPSSASAEGSTFTVRATDVNGSTADRSFGIPFARTATFTTSSSWTAPTGVTSITPLLVGGGGPGGNGYSGTWNSGGGGGGGGAVTATYSVNPGTNYTITVGGSGSSSSISGIATANAGGTGGHATSSNSGGGGSTGGNSGNGGNGIANGSAGGGGAGYLWSTNGQRYGGGGGGGAGFSGWADTYAAAGGAGGGGNGGGGQNGGNGTDGTANTGGGGGGGAGNGGGGRAGGSGIVIIRYNA